MTTLRQYQRESIDAIFDYWAQGGENPLVEAATGVGKSIIIAELCRELLTRYPTMRILCLVHVQELVAQNAEELIKLWPAAPVGINSAGLGRRDKHSTILFASVQSVWRLADQMGDFDLVLIDECHLIPATGDGMYRTLLDGLRRRVPDLRVVGMTATPYRLGTGRLDTGEDRLFTKTVYTYGIAEGVKDGYLAPLVAKGTKTGFDLSDVARRGGEFAESALQAAVDTEELVKAAVDEIVAFGEDRQSWLVFCAGVNHAKNVAEEVMRRGIPSATVHGGTDKDQRKRIIADFKAGRIRCLTNDAVLVAGFNAPKTDLIAMLRGTLSVSRYVQMLGRGTRTVYPAGFDPNTATAEERREAIARSSKPNCIAEGQRVLTDRGLVPIEQVTTEMRVWDGCDWVSHDGPVFRGEREVINYAGLTATPDHRVWTEEGWQTFGMCALARTPITITGIGRQAIRETEGCFRGSFQEAGIRTVDDFGRVYNVLGAVAKRLHQLEETDCGMPGVRQSEERAEVACATSDSREAEMHEPERSEFRPLRRAGDQVLVSISNSNGRLGTGESWAGSGQGNRQDRQQRTLRAGESEAFDGIAERLAYNETNAERGAASLPAGVSSNKVCGQHSPEDGGEDDIRGDRGPILQCAFDQAKRRVWDLANAGPLHRFTVEGLLVHNCLVLDFAQNVRRHGPVDQVRVREKKAGTSVDMVMVKTCPECETLNALGARTCESCGFEFPFSAREANHDTVADGDAPVMSTGLQVNPLAPRWVPVSPDHTQFKRHAKPNSPPSMRVEYVSSSWQSFFEWICFEHTGFARSKAERWWRKMGGQEPVPATVEEGMSRKDELAMPWQLCVKPDGKYTAVVGYKWEPVDFSYRDDTGEVIEEDAA